MKDLSNDEPKAAQSEGPSQRTHRTIVGLLVLIASLMVVACNGNTKTPAPEREKHDAKQAIEKEPTTEAATTEQRLGCASTSDCGQCVTELQAWMRSLVDEGADEVIADQAWLEPVKLLETQQSVRLLPAPIIVIGEKAITFEGIQIGDPRTMAEETHSEIPDLYDALMREWRRGCMGAWDFRSEVIVQVHPTTPWRVVRKVVETAEATHVDSVVFAFLKPTAVTKPSPSGIDAQIARIEEWSPADSLDLGG